MCDWNKKIKLTYIQWNALLFSVKHTTWLLFYPNKCSVFPRIGEFKFLFYFDRTLVIVYVIKIIILIPYAIAGVRSKLNKNLNTPIRRNALLLFGYRTTGHHSYLGTPWYLVMSLTESLPIPSHHFYQLPPWYLVTTLTRYSPVTGHPSYWVPPGTHHHYYRIPGHARNQVLLIWYRVCPSRS